MSSRVVTVTGGTGFVGQSVVRGLREAGYEAQVFDRWRHPASALLRRRFLGTARGGPRLRVAQEIRRGQRRLEPALQRRGLIRPAADDILDVRSRLAARFAGNHAVIHLAGIPHPFLPGVGEDDFRRLNYDASVNVFEAARMAGVPRFVFASSAQVYRIHDPVRVDQFPILETNYLPGLEDGQTLYGFLKAEFERYLAEACPGGVTQAIALRLEYPGVRATTASNFYVCSSLENLVAGFARALEAPDSFAFEAFNLANADTDPAIADVQAAIRDRFPAVPNHTFGNAGALSVEKAQDMLGYRPAPAIAGTYYDESVMW
jgi:nucleoside-diphosphate-sugar epimerase